MTMMDLDTDTRSRGLFSPVLACWRDVLSSFVIIVALSIAYLHAAQKQYTVSATLAPSDAELNILTGISGAGDFGSLSLGRIGLGLGGGDSKFSALLQQLTSGATAEVLLADDRVKAAIYDTIWDPRSRTFHPPSGVLGELRATAKAALGMNPWQPPTAADMQRYLSHNVVAREIGISDLYTVTYSNKDPEFARYFLSRVITISDRYLRERKLARAKAYVDYLDQRLKVVTGLDQRQALLKLRSQQENFLMAASVNLPFSADINDPPIAPSRPTWPNLLIIAVLDLFFGGALAAGIGVYFRPYQSLRRRFAGAAQSRQSMSRDRAIAPNRVP
ncbi:MAG TPA: hypothetical protein VKR31_06320 [Rhizomicrobium sp.]|nr:hypothetical protein [Rhizomicrobium sp.]